MYDLNENPRKDTSTVTQDIHKVNKSTHKIPVTMHVKSFYYASSMSKIIPRH
jgi:hypothetical protein